MQRDSRLRDGKLKAAVPRVGFCCGQLTLPLNLRRQSRGTWVAQRIRTYVRGARSVHGAHTRPRGGKPLALYVHIRVSKLYFGLDRRPFKPSQMLRIQKSEGRSAGMYKDKDKVSVRPYGVSTGSWQADEWLLMITALGIGCNCKL